jgi:hypothetical protein
MGKKKKKLRKLHLNNKLGMLVLCGRHRSKFMKPTSKATRAQRLEVQLKQGSASFASACFTSMKP